MRQAPRRRTRAPRRRRASHLARRSWSAPGEWTTVRHRQRRRSLAQAVLALDLGDLQPADTRERPAAVGDDDGYHDLVRTRRVGDARLHRIEMAAHEGRILVSER